MNRPAKINHGSTKIGQLFSNSFYHNLMMIYSYQHNTIFTTNDAEFNGLFSAIYRNEILLYISENITLHLHG